MHLEGFTAPESQLLWPVTCLVDVLKLSVELIRLFLTVSSSSHEPGLLLAIDDECDNLMTLRTWRDDSVIYLSRLTILSGLPRPVFMTDQIRHASDLSLMNDSDDDLYRCVDESGGPDKGCRDASENGESEMGLRGLDDGHVTVGRLHQQLGKGIEDEFG